jgi:two-component system, chemotaxis family, sensor kinase CheA
MSDEIVREFLVESNENLDLLDREFVQLEKDPSRERLAGVFRTIHTIKGACGFLGFKKLESVAHVGENLLTKLRDGELTLRPEITTALLQMVDAIRQMLVQIDATGAEGERDDAALIETLTALLKGKCAAPPAILPPVKQAVAVPAMADEDGAEKPAPASIGEILIKDGAATAADVASAMRIQREGDPRHLGEILVERGAVKPQEVVEALRTQQVARAAASDSSIRVDVVLLDKLMNLVGELVLARNQILQFANATEEAAIVTPSQQLNLITTELQEGVMKTRMQPIGTIWSKFPRTVRDVAMSCGKTVRIEMVGKETELDKTIIEAIKDPLTHIVRNSVDHGIESPAERTAAGKSPEGLLALRAYHEGGQVIIEISDDGAGLDAEKIRRKGIEKGLITAEQSLRMNERELLHLIFQPGFSTAEKITNVSGRGVGMDVVKTNIDKIGGTVDVQSKPGAGTTVRMKIPLTLAIIPALIVTDGGDRYAIPQVSLLELVRLEGEEARKRIELLQGVAVYRLRGRLLPLVYLNNELRGKPSSRRSTEADVANIVILRADDRKFGLVVDEINDTEEIVVKPLGKQLKGVKIFAGSTIMGDGRVALILDVLGIAQSANVVNEGRERGLNEKAAAPASGSAEMETVLLLQCGGEGRLAMDLSLVARLEEFPRDLIERAGDREVVQYRGQIMPLIRISEILKMGTPARAADDSGVLQVVVYSEQGRNIGLVVDRILDIIEESIDRQQPVKRGGLLGSAVIQEHVTDLLDVAQLVRAANPDFFAPPLVSQEG